MSEIDIYWLRKKLEENLETELILDESRCCYDDIDKSLHKRGAILVLKVLSDILGVDFKKAIHKR